MRDGLQMREVSRTDRHDNANAASPHFMSVRLNLLLTIEAIDVNNKVYLAASQFFWPRCISAKIVAEDYYKSISCLNYILFIWTGAIVQSRWHSNSDPRYY